MMMAFITEIRRLSQPSPEAGACPYLPEAQPDSARVEERVRDKESVRVCESQSGTGAVGFLNP
jgi:hypothetical protein